MENKHINNSIHPKDDTVQRIFALQASLKDPTLLQLNTIGSSVCISLAIQPKVAFSLDYVESTMCEFEDAYTELLRHVRVHNLKVSSKRVCVGHGRPSLLGLPLLPAPSHA